MPDDKDLNSALFKQKLLSSGIHIRVARRTLNMQLIDSAESKKLALPLHAPAIQIPYFNPNGTMINIKEFCRYRYLVDTRNAFAAQTSKKPLRYIQQPVGSLPRLYFPPLVDWSALLSNGNMAPLFITEGELKSACACQMGIPTIGMGGVDCWRSKHKGVELISDFEHLPLVQRFVYIVFDSDASTNKDVDRKSVV